MGGFSAGASLWRSACGRVFGEMTSLYGLGRLAAKLQATLTESSQMPSYSLDGLGGDGVARKPAIRSGPAWRRSRRPRTMLRTLEWEGGGILLNYALLKSIVRHTPKAAMAHAAIGRSFHLCHLGTSGKPRRYRSQERGSRSSRESLAFGGFDRRH